MRLGVQNKGKRWPESSFMRTDVVKARQGRLDLIHGANTLSNLLSLSEISSVMIRGQIRNTEGPRIFEC